MSLNRYVVRVDPQGQTMDVDILDPSGVSVPTFDSTQFAAAPRALPLTIDTQTDFCLAAPGPYDVSCKVGGAEVADGGAPKRVEVSDVPTLIVPDWERQRTATPSGGSVAAGTPIVRAFPFTFDTPDLVTGHEVYTPTVGDLIFNAWVEIAEAWDGTTPTLDFGTFLDSGTGWLGTFFGAVDATIPDADASMVVGQSASGANAVTDLWANFEGTGDAALSAGRLALRKARNLPGKFTTADPIKVCVSTDGTPAGSEPGATQGSAVLYVVTVTPATP